jgi:hypothetical protein
MPLLDQIRETKLIELATARFASDLSDAELKVLHDSASSGDPIPPAADALRPEIRPDFVRWLATDAEAAPYIDPKGLRVFGVTLPDKLDLQDCRIRVTLYFQHCTMKSEINLLFAETRGIFLLDSSLDRGIRADGIDVHGQLFLQGSSFSGEIRLLGAKIKGYLDCSGAKLKVTEGNALSADGAEIGGDVFLRKGFESNGKIRLTGAKIKDNLDCSGAELKVTSGCALTVDRAQIGGGVFLRERFESSGEIRLLGAKIKGNLECIGAQLKVMEGDALSADGAEIGGDVYLIGGFESNGAIHLPGLQVGGDLDFLGAKTTKINCRNLRLTGDMFWMGIQEPGEADLDMTGATVKNLRDDRGSWPHPGRLILDGLAYEELTLHPRVSEEQIISHTVGSGLPLNAKERIEWLMLQPDKVREKPQPWMQLRDLLERKGDRKGAKYVLFRFRCLQAQKSWIPWRWLKILFARLEENPLRICYSIALTLLIGTSIFTWGGTKQAMIETVRLLPNAVKDSGEVKPVSPHYTKYQPFVYTLENALPPVKLGMDDRWTPNPRPEFCQPWFPRLSWLYFISTYGWLNFWRWFLIVWGWVQATVLAASMADRFKK